MRSVVDQIDHSPMQVAQQPNTKVFTSTQCRTFRLPSALPNFRPSFIALDRPTATAATGDFSNGRLSGAPQRIAAACYAAHRRKNDGVSGGVVRSLQFGRYYPSVANVISRCLAAIDPPIGETAA